jgi:hypothetical protein
VVAAGKLNKVSYLPSMHTIVAAHVRYEPVSTKSVNMHFQFKVGANYGTPPGPIGYFSRDVQVEVPKDIHEFLAPLSSHEAEVSYSSGAGGYYPLILLSQQLIYEPFVLVAFTLDSQGNVVKVGHNGNYLEIKS